MQKEQSEWREKKRVNKKDAGKCVAWEGRMLLVLCRSRGIWGICRSPASHCLLGPLVLRLLFEQSVMCGELPLQSGLSCNSIHSAMSDGAAQPGCQKERCDARLKGKYFRDSNSRPQHVLLARKHCLYSGFDNFNAIVIVIWMILEVH